MNSESISANGLGELERAILNALWDNDGPMVVREIADHLEKADGKSRAYTTVMTVADRLAKKGLATRERDGRAWAYRASASREEMAARALRETLEDWAPKSDSDAVLHFLRDVPESDMSRLRAALGKLA